MLVIGSPETLVAHTSFRSHIPSAKGDAFLLPPLPNIRILCELKAAVGHIDRYRPFVLPSAVKIRLGRVDLGE